MDLSNVVVLFSIFSLAQDENKKEKRQEVDEKKK
jgi:hypothetical protein